MDQEPALELAYQLPRDLYYQIVHELTAGLPPPVTDTPEDRLRRDNAAMAQVASLLPANGDEANLAAQYVAASAQALANLREAQAVAPDARRAQQCQAQAVSMMRQAHNFRALLLRVQAARARREANGATLGRGEWVEHCALGLMADALGRPASVPPAEPSQAAPPLPAADAQPDLAEPPPPDESSDLAAEADRYAIIYPRRAALIRAQGGLTDDENFGPPSPELVRALVTGRSPTLRALDVAPEAPAAA